MQKVKGGERQEMERRQQYQGLQQQSIREDREIFMDPTQNDAYPGWKRCFAMIDNHNRNSREELLFNSGGSIQNTLYSIRPEATPDQIKTFCCIIIQILKHLHNICLLSNLFNRNLIKLCQLAHPGLNIDNDTSTVSCIHYANSLHGKTWQ